jgi:hypothetical protein
MNKKVIFTALALGGAIVYALRKITRHSRSQPKAGPKMSKHIGGEFTDRGAQAMG